MNNKNSVQGLINQQLGRSIWKPFDVGMTHINCTAIMEKDFTCSHIRTSEFAQKQGYEHILTLADNNGDMSFVNTKTMLYWNLKVHCGSIFDVAWMFNDMKLVTVSASDFMKLIDVSEKGIETVRVFKGVKKPMHTVAFKKEDTSIFVTGGIDGHILFWDTRAPSYCDYIVESDEMTRFGQSLQYSLSWITGLVFQNEYTLITCSAGDGIIKIWDVRKTYKIAGREAVPKNTIPCFINSSKYGFSNLTVNKTGDRLYTSCIDSMIYCYNILTYNPEPIMSYTGQCMDTFYYKSCLSGDDLYLLRGGCNPYACIWNIKCSQPICHLEVPSLEVKSVAWSQSIDTTLATCSEGIPLQIWQVNPLYDISPED